eukprot:9386205-Pyramimonas_sp.AAC.1
MIARDHKKAIIEDRKRYRGACCTCPTFADDRLGCPVRRPSRSPNCRNKNTMALCDKQLAERDYLPATTTEIEQTNAMWHNLAPTHYLAQFNREWHAGKPADHKSEEESQPE